MLSPAERADLLIDFSQLAGSQFTLQDTKLTIMRFRVGGEIRGGGTAGEGCGFSPAVLQADSAYGSKPHLRSLRR